MSTRNVLHNMIRGQKTAPGVVQTIMRQGTITIQCQLHMPHINGETSAEFKAADRSERFSTGNLPHTHSVGHYMWAFLLSSPEDYQSVAKLPASQNGHNVDLKLPNAMIVTNANGKTIAEASDHNRCRAIGLTFGDYNATKSPGKRTGTNAGDSPVIGVCVFGTVTVYCICLEELLPGTYFGVKFPSTPDELHAACLLQDDFGNGYIAKHFWNDHEADTVFPIMYKVDLNYLSTWHGSLIKQNLTLYAVGSPAAGVDANPDITANAKTLKPPALPPVPMLIQKVFHPIMDAWRHAMQNDGEIVTGLNKLGLVLRSRTGDSDLTGLQDHVESLRDGAAKHADRLSVMTCVIQIICRTVEEEVKRQMMEAKGYMVTGAPIGASRPDVMLMS